MPDEYLSYLHGDNEVDDAFLLVALEQIIWVHAYPEHSAEGLG